MYGLFIFLCYSLISAAINPGSNECRRRRLCLKNQIWDRSSRADVQAASCYCDDECILFNDCCINSLNSDLKTRNDDFICTAEGLAESYYIQQKCPSRTETTLKDLCENPSNDDPLTMVPATSLKSLFTYRNIFCAVCNGEVVLRLRVWNPVVSCSLSLVGPQVLNGHLLRSNLHYNFNTKQWDFGPLRLFMNGYQRNVTCETLYSIPPTQVLGMTQKCQENIYWCSDDWQQENIAMKCVEGYTALVYRNDSFAYKNVYCAICNHVPLKEVQCQVTEDLLYWDKITGDKLIDYINFGEHSDCASQFNEAYSFPTASQMCSSGKMLVNNICVPNTLYSAGYAGNDDQQCTFEAVMPSNPVYRFLPRHCFFGFINDPFLGQCRSVTGKKEKPIVNNNFLSVYKNFGQPIQVSNNWHFHRLNVRKNIGTPEEESFSNFQFSHSK